MSSHCFSLSLPAAFSSPVILESGQMKIDGKNTLAQKKQGASLNPRSFHRESNRISLPGTRLPSHSNISHLKYLFFSWHHPLSFVHKKGQENLTGFISGKAFLACLSEMP
jgi:hypothetical protein